MKKQQIKTGLYILIGLFTTIGIVFFTSNSKEKKTNGIPMVVLDSAKTDFDVRIHDWRVLGPFADDKKNTWKGEKSNFPGLYYDYLKDFGFSEAEINASDVPTIIKSKSNKANLLVDDFTNGYIRDTSRNIIFSKYFRHTDNSTVYAFFEIYSPKEQDVVFITGSDDGMKAYLNNRVIINKPTARSMREYQDIGIGHLRKGKNLFFAKVYNDLFEWGLNVSIYSYSKAREVLMANNLLKLLDDAIYDHPSDSLKFNIALYPSKSHHAEASIYNPMGNKIMTKDFGKKDYLNIALTNLTKGIYLAKVDMDAGKYEQWFYYGNNSDSLLSSYMKRCEKFRDSDAKINLQALLTRYEHLINPENKKADDPVWQSKLLFIIKELECVLTDLENGNQAFRNKLGIHLRGFRSKIDDQEQFYKVYVPSQYKDGEKPSSVVIIVPAITAPIRPFLKSIHVANLIQEEEHIRASEKYGHILLWANSRGYNYGNPIENSDVLDALAALKKDYKIDENRIYLTGYCTGGLDALTLGMRYPTLFAAIGLFSPLTDRTSIAKSHFDIPFFNCEFWLKQNTPLLFANNFKNLPIYILHGEKNHAPLQHSLNFVENCKRVGVNPYFKIIYDEISPGMFSTNYTIFDFFESKTLDKNPKVVDYSTSQLKYNHAYWVTINKMDDSFKKATIHADHTKPNLIKVEAENVSQYEIQLTNMEMDKSKPLVIMTNGKINFSGLVKNNKISIDVNPDIQPTNTLSKNHDTEGPILHAFERGFILADCKNPALKGNIEMSAACDSLVKAWKRDYFVDGCRYKKASTINSKDIDNYNLVLIGNQDNNILIKKIINQIPLKYSSDSIILGGKVFKGEKIGFLMIYPNPLNKRNYIVLVSSNNWKDFIIPKIDLSMEGCFDYIIWETLSNKSQNILDIGYFDSSWQKAISTDQL